MEGETKREQERKEDSKRERDGVIKGNEHGDRTRHRKVEEMK